MVASRSTLGGEHVEAAVRQNSNQSVGGKQDIRAGPFAPSFPSRLVAFVSGQVRSVLVGASP